ncbi:FapA family protein [uncultured Ferrimonas sp.]|uniref:DUF342 domain-containing protein n=1 Tax=uncultured Ferrimonas sp. TaxID=432640 RepID=UPI00260D6276|nr:FapA family protein [uncultured Ferrimonas sp.]
MLEAHALLWDPEQKQLTLLLDPAEHQRTSPADIQRLFESSRFACLQPQSQDWPALLQQLETAEVPLTLVVAKQLDGFWQLEISADQMQLSASLTLPHGGKHASVDDLLVLLKQKNIQQGLSRNAIKALLEHSRNGSPGSVHQGIIAKGKPAQTGHDGYLQRLVKLAHERHLTPQAKDRTRVDLRDLGTLQMVGRGEVLMQRHPPSQGEHGYDLFGRQLLAEPGNVVKLTPGVGTELSATDPNLLVASRSGLPIESLNGMAVDELLTVKEVSVRSGHLNFDGAIQIHGNVAEGMHVKASGDVHITGLVEGAIIEAGGDITIAQGVIGRQREQQLSCKLQAGGNIHVKYAQFTHINAIGNIHIELQCNHCQLESQQHIEIGDPQRMQGGLFGGQASARGSLICVELGTKAGAETKVQIGSDYQPLKQQVEQLMQQQTELSKQIVTQQLQLKQLVQEHASTELQQPLRQSVASHKARLGENQQQLEQQELALQDFYQHLDIKVLKQLHPRVLFEIGHERHSSSKETGPSRIAVSSNKIEIQPYTPPKRR